MFSFLLKTCTNCNNLEDAICAIDAVLAQYGKNAWQNTAFMTIKPIPHVRMRQLLYYKELLNNLRWNQDLYCPYDFSTIVSRVKALTGGEFKIARRMVIPTYTTTTSTTTTSTSSTTSTTTSTSTSTTTSTSTSTTSTTSTTTSSTTSTSTSTSSTTSTTTTTTTTALPQLIATNNAETGEAVLLAITYDNYPPNNPQFAFGAFPVIPGDSKQAGILPSFIPGTFYISVDEDLFGTLTIVGSDGAVQCQNYSGLSLYTFTNVVVNLSNPVTITMSDTGTVCTTTTTTTSTTTTTTTTV